MGVSTNGGTPKHPLMFIGFYINHPAMGVAPLMETSIFSLMLVWWVSQQLQDENPGISQHVPGCPTARFRKGMQDALGMWPLIALLPWHCFLCWKERLLQRVPSSETSVNWSNQMDAKNGTEKHLCRFTVEKHTSKTWSPNVPENCFCLKSSLFLIQIAYLPFLVTHTVDGRNPAPIGRFIR